MYDKENWVTCMHCDHFKPLLCDIKGQITAFDLIPCVKLGVNRKALDPICKYFVLRQGMHTKKYYPGKEKQEKIAALDMFFWDCEKDYTSNYYDRDEMIIAIKEYDKELGRQVSELRKRKRVTIKKMAEITHLSLQEYKLLEKGCIEEDLSTTDILLYINDYFGVLLHIPFEY